MLIFLIWLTCLILGLICEYYLPKDFKKQTYIGLICFSVFSPIFFIFNLEALILEGLSKIKFKRLPWMK